MPFSKLPSRRCIHRYVAWSPPRNCFGILAILEDGCLQDTSSGFPRLRTSVPRFPKDGSRAARTQAEPGSQPRSANRLLGLVSSAPPACLRMAEISKQLLICRSIPVFGMTASSSIPACSLIPILWHGTAIAVRGTRLKTKTAFPLCCPTRAVEGGRACRYKCPQKDESGAKIRKFLYGRCFFRPEIRG